MILVFSALRVYALWDRNTLIALHVLVLGLVPVVTNIVSLRDFFLFNQYFNIG